MRFDFLLFYFILNFSFCFFFSSRRRHTRLVSDLSSGVCSSDLDQLAGLFHGLGRTIRIVVRNELDLAAINPALIVDHLDRKSAVKGKSVNFVGGRTIKKKKQKNQR